MITIDDSELQVVGLPLDEIVVLEKDDLWVDLSLIGSQNYQYMEDEVIRLTNLERTKIGIQPLKRSNILSQSALLHTLDMAENHFISHAGSDGSTLKKRVLRIKDTPWLVLGENLAMGQHFPEQVVRAWMNSPGHRENLLNHTFNEIGVAYIEGNIKASDGSFWRAGYWTQHFGRRYSIFQVGSFLTHWINNSSGISNEHDSAIDIKILE